MSASRDTDPAHGTPDGSSLVDSQGLLFLDEVVFVHEAPGDLFDAPDGAAIIRTMPFSTTWCLPWLSLTSSP
jgi:hypothetical protein